MIVKWNVKIPELSGDQTRRVYVYLPASYKKQIQRRYPVLYMFDGHNVFFDKDATYGKSWGMNEYLKKSRKQMIVVAVECNHQGNSRLSEYSPHSFSDPHFGHILGKGRIYMTWLVKTLKPYIDEKFRTLPDRNCTSICGSSMGGLMALYGATVYNRIFRNAACLSPSLWTDCNQILRMIAKANLRSDTCIYMDYGSEEIANHAGILDELVSVSTLLLSRKVKLTFRIVPGGTHCEASWEKQIPVFMECLGL